MADIEVGEFRVGVYRDGINAWGNAGTEKFKLTDEEKEDLTLQEILQLMQEYREEHMWRCSNCGKDIGEEEIGGRPLFVGVNCIECWKEHLGQVERQRENGKVCGLCGKPYLECYC